MMAVTDDIEAPGLRECVKCGWMKPLDRFQDNRTTCRDCRNVAKLAASKRKYAKVQVITIGTKYCGHCHRTLPVDAFYISRARMDGRHNTCKQCRDAMKARWLENNREHAQEKHWELTLRKNFGLTLEQYHAKWDEQGGVCAICKRPEWAKGNGGNGKIRRLSVDHDHTTGKIRGLLCSSCNVMLGHMRDNMNRARAAMQYIERYQESEAKND